MVPIVEAVVPVAETVADTVAPIVEAVVPVVEAVVDTVAPIVEAVVPVVETVTETVAPIVETVTETVAPIVETVPTVAPIVEAVVPVVETVVKTVGPIVEAVVPVVETVTEAVDPVVETVVDTVGPIVEAVVPVVETVGDLAPIVETVTETVTPIVQAVVPVVDTVVEAVVPVVDTVAHASSAHRGPDRRHRRPDRPRRHRDGSPGPRGRHRYRGPVIAAAQPIVGVSTPSSTDKGTTVAAMQAETAVDATTPIRQRGTVTTTTVGRTEGPATTLSDPVTDESWPAPVSAPDTQSPIVDAMPRVHDLTRAAPRLSRQTASQGLAGRLSPLSRSARRRPHPPRPRSGKPQTTRRPSQP